MTDQLPKKLKDDAILEAVLEIRFEPGSSPVSEIVVGRLADATEWRQFKSARLPTADIPGPIRRADPELRYQPSLELTSNSGSIAVRVGPQVIAYSRRGAYPGWVAFGAQLEKVVDHLFRSISEIQISRIGLRYVNALRSDLHEIRGIGDIDINVSVAGHVLRDHINLNFKKTFDEQFEVMSRIATIDLAQGSIPENSTIIVDVDVSTNLDFLTSSDNFVKEWISRAHDREKESFFSILGERATNRLREE